MPPTLHPNISRVLWDKEQEIKRIASTIRSSPVDRKRLESGVPPPLDDCQRTFLYLARETAERPSFHATRLDIYHYLRPDDDEAGPKQAADYVRPLLTKLRIALKNAEKSSDVLQSAYRITFRGDNDAGTGVRLRFRRRPSNPRRPGNALTPSEAVGATHFWQKLIGPSKLRKALLVYDAPDVVRIKLLERARPGEAVTAKAKNERGRWARSSDVAAVFNLGSILLQLKLPTSVLRWRDMRHEDIAGLSQCIVMIGNSSHKSLSLMRRRDEWSPRRSFRFTELIGRAACARIEDLRPGSASGSPLVYKHVRDAAGGTDTDYAVFSFYRDLAHDQILVGVMGTSADASREAALFITRDDRAVEMERFIQTRRGKALDERPRAFEVRLRVTFRDGQLEEISPVDAVVYEI